MFCTHPQVSRYVTKFLSETMPVVFEVAKKRRDDLPTRVILVVLGSESRQRPILARYIFSINKIFRLQNRNDWMISSDETKQVEDFVRNCVAKMGMLNGFPCSVSDDITWKLVLEVGGLQQEAAESFFGDEFNSNNTANNEVSSNNGLKVGEVLSTSKITEGLLSGSWKGNVAPHPTLVSSQVSEQRRQGHLFS